MALKFSQNGEYYAEISNSGKLKVWNTFTNSFEQEFTPNIDLASQCTCLHFIEANSQKYKGASPKKKKRKISETIASLNIVLGTESGLLLVYSVPKANLEYTINSETSQSLTCLSSANYNVIYSGAEQNVFVWNLEKKKLVSKWKVCNERVSTILAVPESQQILIAAENITLWDVAAKEVLRTFIRHSSEVTLLHFIAPQSNGDSYFISGSKDDRLLDCWSLSKNSSDKKALTSFQLDDVIQNISVLIAADGSTNVAATVKSGVVHIYQHTLNGKCGKPIKPTSTIQIVSDAGHSKDVTPFRIVGAVHRDEKHLCIGHGINDLLTFENISIISKKVQRLIRKDPRTSDLPMPDQNFKTITHIVNDDSHCQTPQMSSVSKRKMKTNGLLEVSMETRLRNLEMKMSPSDNFAQLLVQGLHSKDKNILTTVLGQSEEHIIENSVKQLPITVVAPLCQKIGQMIREENMGISALTWLKHILKIHADVLLDHPDSSLLESLDDSVDDRSEAIRLQTEAIIKFPRQIEGLKESNEVEPAIEYGDSSDSDIEDIQMEIHSESENEWDEDSEEEQIEENNKGSESEADSL